jgi:energy-coupling factor transporter transmembrane protein EcfT
MDNTLIYSIVGGVAVVMLFVAARFAFRWLIRFAIVGVIMTALACAAWVWSNYSSSAQKTPPTPTRRTNASRQ